MRNFLDALWNFARPHTIFGTSLAIISLYLIALLDSHNTGDLKLFSLTFLAGLAINLYVVGLNQITDIEIDKVNKPYLPLASNKLTRKQAAGMVIFSAVTAFITAIALNLYLFSTILIVFIVGTAYSLPPVRLKRFPLFASLCIISARGIAGNAGVYLSYSSELSGKAQLPLHVLIFIVLMTCFSAVIAIMKDVPDIDGDRQYSISTLVTKIGTANVLTLCKAILILSYLFMIGVGLLGITRLNSYLLVASHTLFLVIFLFRSNLDPFSNRQKIFRYYMFIWNLFYLEFFVFFLAVAFAKNPLV